MPELQDYEEDQAPSVDLGPEVPDFPPVPPPTQVQGPMAQPQAQPQGNPRDRLLPPPPPPRADGRTVYVPSIAEVAQQRRQRQEDAFIKGVYNQAQNFDQAMKDVTSARRMLGILKADREIKSGVPVDQAMYRNIQYFVQPGDRNFAADVKAVRPAVPVPSPTALNLPGLPPGVVDAKGVPHWPSAAATKASQPPVEYLPKEVDYGGEKWMVNTKTGHFERKDKGKTAAVMTPAQMQQGLIAESHIVERQLAAETDKKKKEALMAELNDKKAELRKFRQPAPPAVSPSGSERIRVKAADGKVGTIPRSQLEQAKKAGYSVLNASD